MIYLLIGKGVRYQLTLLPTMVWLLSRKKKKRGVYIQTVARKSELIGLVSQLNATFVVPTIMKMNSHSGANQNHLKLIFFL